MSKTNFLGEIVAIHSLVGAENRFTPIQFMQLDVLPPKHKEFALLEAVQGVNQHSVMLTLMNEDGSDRRTEVVNRDLQVKKLSGTRADKMRELRARLIFTNMPNLVAGAINATGADPEFFVDDENGNLIPSFKFLREKGNKETSAETYEIERGENTDFEYGATDIYWDGFQAEFTVASHECHEVGTHYLRSGLQRLLAAAQKVDRKAKLSTKTLISVPLAELANTEEKFVEFGCKPSFNAYGLKSDLSAGGRNIPFRSSGGHIHMGLMAHQKNEKSIIEAVKMMDATIGLMGVCMFEKYDDPIRRTFYGMAGEYRTPAHGLEYRVLSNAWLFHPLVSNLVRDIARAGAVLGFSGYRKHIIGTEQEIVDAIQNCDVEKARKLLNANKELIMAMIGAVYGVDGSQRLAIFNALTHPIGDFIANPDDIAGNWELGKQFSHQINWYVRHYNFSAKKQH